MRTALTLAALLSALAAPVSAQVSAPVLRGTLHDSVGRPMPDIEVAYRRTTTVTDIAGNFRLTPVPLGRIMVTFARRGTVFGELEANITADTMPSVAVEVVSERTDPRTLLGVVVDSSGRAMRDVVVEVVTAMVETKTDSAGRFTFRGLMPQRHFIRVRRLGYAPTFAAVDLADGTAKRARIVMRQFAGQNLGLVVVRANRVPQRMQGFMQRAARGGMGGGRILTEEDIVNRNPIRTSDLFQAIAGVRVAQDRFGRGTLVGRGNCLMQLFINGFPAPQLVGSGVDDIISPLDLAGVEIYNGVGFVPPELTMGPPSSCGTVGLWTK